MNQHQNNCDKGQTLISVDKALQLLLKQAIPNSETETIDLLEAGGRILAQDLCSTLNVPPADNSAMDGYAVCSADICSTDICSTDIGTTNKRLSFAISQRICAGEMGTTLKAHTAARIFTGAPIPDGADAVIMQEQCEADTKSVTISGAIKTTISAGMNIRKAGEDIAIGDTILKKGIKLRPQDIGLVASVGIRQLTVYRRLRVAIFFTGNELCEPGTKLNKGQIYNSNRYILRGLLQNLGCEIIDLGIVKDNLIATCEAMQSAAEQADLVMTSGGVSVGEEDYIRIALQQLGQLDLWRINIKPGKPLAFGKIADTPFLGMPGNPVSVFATFCVFAHPYILKKSGATNVLPKRFNVPAAFTWNKKGKRCEYIRVRMEQDAIGNTSLGLFPHQGSGVLTSTSWANGLAIIPPDTSIEKGDNVAFIPFSELGSFGY